MRRSMFAVAALSLCAVALNASAQDGNVNQGLRDAPLEQRYERPNPGEDVVSIVDTVRTPRFRVEQINFYATDESGGWDTGSDEIIAVAFVGDYFLASQKFENVDTGDVRNFPRSQRCLYPAYDPDQQRNGRWNCRTEGAPGPISLRIEIREHDGDWFPSGACLYSATDILGHRCDLRLNESNDLGGYHLRMSTEELVAAMPSVGSTHEMLIPFSGEDSGYIMTLRFTRRPDLVEQVERVRAQQ